MLHSSHQWMLVYKGHQQKTCLKKEYHIRNNATKTSVIKYITAEQKKATCEKGKRAATARVIKQKKVWRPLSSGVRGSKSPSEGPSTSVYNTNLMTSVMRPGPRYELGIASAAFCRQSTPRAETSAVADTSTLLAMGGRLKMSLFQHVEHVGKTVYLLEREAASF